MQDAVKLVQDLPGLQAMLLNCCAPQVWLLPLGPTCSYSCSFCTLDYAEPVRKPSLKVALLNKSLCYTVYCPAAFAGKYTFDVLLTEHTTVNSADAALSCLP